MDLADEARRQRNREWNRLYRERHPERIKEQKKRYKSSAKGKEKTEIWNAANVSLLNTSREKWYLVNKDSCFQKAKEYVKAHPAWKASHCAKRRAKKLQAMPAWVDADHLWIIEEAHQLARLRSEATGISWDVDHIVPLTNKIVCGLHVYWNMQVIPSVVNYRKHNKLCELNPFGL